MTVVHKYLDDREEYHVDEHTRVVITRAMFFCPRCYEWKPASEFGLRHEHTKHGIVIRNQSYCSKCR
jgi:ribosomal protein S27AE